MASMNESRSSISTDVPPGHRPPVRTDTERSAVHGTVRNAFWRMRNLLSLDGGGIRGYWTLLVLERLMKSIFLEELKQAAVGQTAFHSFMPEAFPDNVSQLDDDETGKKNPGRIFLPCHYFDFICGTSTGGLIAIMLGRFRMTVEDCLDEYKTMSDRIFGKPRWISQRNMGMPWPKYSSRSMEKAFQDVSLRRSDSTTTGKHHSTMPTFPSTEGICQTFVTTERTTKNTSGVDTKDFYLIRSYSHEENTRPVRPPNPDTSRRMVTPPKTNFGPAETMEIPKVARAVTAAPMYFKRLEFTHKIGTHDQKYYFTDGGFGRTNNPTVIGLDEIDSIPGKHTIGAIVNIGTSRGNKADPSRTTALGIVKALTDEATNPGDVAKEMGRLNLDKYWRFNDDGGINVELDEWRPAGFFTKRNYRGTITIDTIEHAFNKWAAEQDNVYWLDHCARELVKIRRGRCIEEEKSRWEQYALAAHSYRCKHEDCCTEPAYTSRHQFVEHWERVHEESDDGDDYKEPRFKQWIYQQKGPERRK
ncbi:FabD/lysophospholipase-like protein [Didymella exigua CBS 183.55]|uniref:FabD/lysophospholipase-like protein n=1 Tax=Didymella exigua CBS 183.55 TaxID=1150837 RepID=A0A6A5RRE7_9PLEO|nr:FabD/lysophospholipase-like protein [Didymella exigua CBS 183.55]KAF1930023.1 FabD/lysophospholipase-like protein [Didymella exigua CBS 183.55]